MTSTKRASLDCAVLRGNAFDDPWDLLGTVVGLHDDDRLVVVEVRVVRRGNNLTALSLKAPNGSDSLREFERVVRPA